MIKVAVTGAAGRMGSGIIRRITQQDDMEVVAAIEMPGTPLEGRDAGVQAGIEELGVEIVGSEKLEETLKSSGAEVLVDFTIAHAAVETIKIATSCGVSVVVGTTGFTEEQMAEIKPTIAPKNVESLTAHAIDNNIGTISFDKAQNASEHKALPKVAKKEEDYV